MLLIFSLSYGPFIVWLMNSFEPKTSSIVVLLISLILILLHWREKSSVWIIPFVYLAISISTLIFGKTTLLMFGPLAISTGLAVLLGMKNKTPLMIQNAINNWKFLKNKNISKKQIRSNTWVWLIGAWINVFVHIIFLAFAPKWAWAIYVSVGWYSVFALCAIAHLYIWQHRKKMKKKLV